MSRTGDDVLASVENIATDLYARACANERSNLVGGMVTTLTLETADAKQFAQDLADILMTIRNFRRRTK